MVPLFVCSVSTLGGTGDEDLAALWSSDFRQILLQKKIETYVSVLLNIGF